MINSTLDTAQSITLRQACRNINRFAWPIIVSNITVPLLSLVDAIVLGHLPNHDFFASVAIADMLFNFLYLIFGFLRMSTTGFTAQAIGQQNYTQIRQLLLQSFVWSLTIALLLLLLRHPILQLGLWFFSPPTSLVPLIKDYFLIRILAAPATLANIALSGWLLGVSRTRWILVITAFINVTAIVLDISLVYGYHLNVKGIAYAITIAQYSGLALGLCATGIVLQHYPGQWQIKKLFCYQTLKRIGSANQNLFFRSCLLMFVFCFIVKQGGQLGSVILAVNSIFLTLQHLLAYTLDGFVAATETLVGQAIGQRDKAQYRQVVRASTLLAAMLALMYSVVYALTEHRLLALFTNIPAVLQQAQLYFVWMIISPLISVWAYLLDGIFIGATHSRDMRNSMLVSSLVFFSVWYLSQPWGNHGLWLAFTSFLAMRGLSLAILYKRIRVGA